MQEYLERQEQQSIPLGAKSIDLEDINQPELQKANQNRQNRRKGILQLKELALPKLS